MNIKELNTHNSVVSLVATKCRYIFEDRAEALAELAYKVCEVNAKRQRETNPAEMYKILMDHARDCRRKALAQSRSRLKRADPNATNVENCSNCYDTESPVYQTVIRDAASKLFSQEQKNDINMRILSLLCKSLSVSQIADELGLNKSSVSRRIKTIKSNYIEKYGNPLVDAVG